VLLEVVNQIIVRGAQNEQYETDQNVFREPGLGHLAYIPSVLYRMNENCTAKLTKVESLPQYQKKYNTSIYS